jgi:hypothetical protein
MLEYCNIAINLAMFISQLLQASCNPNSQVASQVTIVVFIVVSRQIITQSENKVTRSNLLPVVCQIESKLE